MSTETPNNTHIVCNKNVEFVFYHIEKCAGSSLRIMLHNYFKEIYDNAEIFTPEFNNDGHLNLSCQAYKRVQERGPDFIEYLNKLKVILCHISYEDPKFVIKSSFSITAIRNPIKRALSHYAFFTQKQTNKHIEQLNNKQLNEWVKGAGNVMTWRLSSNNGDIDEAKRNILCLNKVIVVETIDADIKDLAQMLQMKHKINFDTNMIKRNENTSKPKKKQNYVFIEKLICLLYKDVELYYFFIKTRWAFRKMIATWLQRKTNREKK